MDKLHPELLAHFADQQKEQQRFVQTAMVGRNVRQVKEATLALMDKYIERGLQMDESATRADEVLRESERFAHEAQGENRFFRCVCIPIWWFECPPPPPQSPNGRKGSQKKTRI